MKDVSRERVTDEKPQWSEGEKTKNILTGSWLVLIAHFFGAICSVASKPLQSQHCAVTRPPNVHRQKIIEYLSSYRQRSNTLIILNEYFYSNRLFMQYERHWGRCREGGERIDAIARNLSLQNIMMSFYLIFLLFVSHSWLYGWDFGNWFPYTLHAPESHLSLRATRPASADNNQTVKKIKVKQMHLYHIRCFGFILNKCP